MDPRPVTLDMDGKSYAIVAVRPWGPEREGRISGGREALAEGLTRRPLRAVFGPDGLPVERPLFTVLEWIDLLAAAIAKVLVTPGEDVTALAEEIVTHWWWHEGDGAVLRACGAPRAACEAADLRHMLGFETYRTYTYPKARAMIAASVRRAAQDAFRAGA